MSVRLYVEGGGDGKYLRLAFRQGFIRFLTKAGFSGRMPKVVACGGRQQAYGRFRTAHEKDTQGRPAMLLVDAERQVETKDPWQHLADRDDWKRPRGATDDQCHLMVQVMESWFLADRAALDEVYGQGFQASALPRNPTIEDIPKRDVLTSLERAASRTTKGRYSKGAHSFEILASIDPEKVEQASPFAKRFLDALRKASP